MGKSSKEWSYKLPGDVLPWGLVYSMENVDGRANLMEKEPNQLINMNSELVLSVATIWLVMLKNGA